MNDTMLPERHGTNEDDIVDELNVSRIEVVRAVLVRLRQGPSKLDRWSVDAARRG